MTVKGPFVDIVAGARPNFMKAGPIYQAIMKKGVVKARFVYSGQHTDPIMSADIYRSVGLPSHPDVILGTNTTPGFEYLGYMMAAYNAELKYGPHKPLACVVLGDTDTALAVAIVASRNEVAVIHVEAGVRSHDYYSPEELNRIMIDSVSDLLLTPFDEATDEVCHTVRGRTQTVGNVMVDALMRVQGQSSWDELKIPYDFDVLVTIHRQSNVNDKYTLSKIISSLDTLSEKHRLLFPVHPRTRDKLNEMGIHRTYMVPPMEYTLFLKALTKAKAVITDSGGVQAEAAAVGVPCYVLRGTTGWTNLQDLRLVTLVTLDNMCTLVGNACTGGKCKIKCVIPHWDGGAADRIAHCIRNFIQSCPKFIRGEY